MSCDFVALAAPGVQKLTPYQPGKPIDELKRELGLTGEIVKLASNENPLGTPPAALAAMQAAMGEIARYPDGNGFVLKQALATKYGVGLDQITLGNGSNDVLEIIARAFLTPADEAIYAQHAFAVYPLAVQAIGARGIEVPAKAYGHDLAAMAAAVTERTKLIFLANPNNPTGTWFERAELEAFLAAVPERVVIVLDEAYIEYVDTNDFPNGLDYLAQHPNLIVSRTFSKAYGLAALRVGYALADAQLTNVLNRVRQPFNVNSLALVAAAAALGADDFVVESRQLNRAGMAQLETGLKELGLPFVPSRGNFLLVDLGRPAASLYDALLRQGVIVRPVGAYGLPNHLRVSVGLAAENARFLDALKTVLA